MAEKVIDTEGYPTKEIREKCWAQRDMYWKCLDDNNDQAEKCTAIRKNFENLCPKQWVTHFDRRRKFLQFKAKMESGNFDPVEYYGGQQEKAKSDDSKGSK